MSENTQNQCAGCNVPAGGVYQISEPSRIKPSMSMHVSLDDHKQDLAKWEAENKQPETLRALIDRFSRLPVDHAPNGWPAVQTKEITALLDHIADIEGQLEAIGAGGVESLRQSNQHAITTAAARAGTVYVSGPMTGYVDLNFPAFNAEAAKLREQGLKVTNPADHGEVPGAQWADYLRTDVAQLAACERIHLLPGWSKSKGAQLELHLAKALEMQITLTEGAEPLELAAVQQGAPALNVSQETIDFLKESIQDCDDRARDVAISHDLEKILLAAPHPTQQGLDAPTQTARKDAKEVFCKKCEMSVISSCGSESGCPVRNIYAAQAKQGEQANG